jgi:hypothetical protein
MDLFEVKLIGSTPRQITHIGKAVQLKDLIGTNVWDAVNDIITLADMHLQIAKQPLTGKVNNVTYGNFVFDTKMAIAQAMAKRH